jgi:hypothetical protein
MGPKSTVVLLVFFFWPPQRVITMATLNRNCELIGFPLPCSIIYNLLRVLLWNRPHPKCCVSGSNTGIDFPEFPTETAPAVVSNEWGVGLHYGAEGSPLATNSVLVNAVNTCHLTF